MEGGVLTPKSPPEYAPGSEHPSRLKFEWKIF